MDKWPDDKPVALDSIMISDTTVSCACPYCGSINERTFEDDFFSNPDYRTETIECWDCGREFILPNILFDDIDAYAEEPAGDDYEDEREDFDVLEEDDDDVGPPPMDGIDDIDYFKMWDDFDPEEEE